MNDYLKDLIDQIDQAILEIKFGNKPPNLYEPIQYILGLGGKRIRPLLCLLAYQLYHDDFEKALKPSLAIEVFHNFTLLHDDIMDKAPLRRNHPTVHEKWNENIAILSGDVMLVRVYDLLVQVDQKIIKEAITRFNNCAAEVCEGQQYDMDFETMKTVTEAEYVEMIKLKTAVLLGYSMELGGLIAGAPEHDIEHLREFGINMGIGFQLMDDLLDVYAEAELFGKQVGGDIISNKKTYLLIKTLELANNEDYKELKKWIDAENFDEKEKVNAVKAVYDRLEIKKLTQEHIRLYFEKSLEEFSKINVSKDRKLHLMELVTYLMNREK
jgi:geranylgeranyl diphosphate synthase type II